MARMQHRGAILADGKTGDGCACCYKNRIAFFASLRMSAAGFSEKLRRRDALPE